MYICKYCGQEFESKQKLASHTRLCKNNPNREHNLQILKNNGRNTCNKINESKKQEIVEYKLICPNCGNQYAVSITENQYKKGKYKKYCSRKCANKRILTEETKNKISKSLKKPEKSYICQHCGKTYFYIKGENTASFCSKECIDFYRNNRKLFLSNESIEKLSVGGRNSAKSQKESKRSKNEKLFCYFCEKEYKLVLHNETIFDGWDADIILPDYKIAILWNGPWHYKQIFKNTSLKQIQNRDNIKIEKIKNCGYTPYIIKDMGKFSKKFVEVEFEKFKKYIAD